MWPKHPSQRLKSPAHEDEAKLIHTNLPLMEIHGSIQFKLDKNAYRMIPLANSEDFLYNRGSLQRQREVGGEGGKLSLLWVNLTPESWVKFKLPCSGLFCVNPRVSG